MRYYKQIGASAALLTGLASGLAISTLDPSAAHAAETEHAAEIEADTSAWGTPTTTQSKIVTYIDSAGKIVGTGKLTVYCDDVQEGSRKYYSLSYWLDNSIPAGYKLLDNSSLGNFPDTLTIVVDSSSSVPSSAHFGKTFGQLATSDPSNPSTSSMTRIVKHVSYVTDGKVNGTDVKYSVGTGTIYAVDKIVDGKKVTVYELDDSVPKGYYSQPTSD